MKKRLRKAVAAVMLVSMLTGGVGSIQAAAETTGSGTKEFPYRTETENTTTDENGVSTTIKEVVSEWSETTDTDYKEGSEPDVKKSENKIVDNQEDKTTEDWKLEGMELGKGGTKIETTEGTFEVTDNTEKETNRGTIDLEYPGTNPVKITLTQNADGTESTTTKTVTVSVDDIVAAAGKLPEGLTGGSQDAPASVVLSEKDGEKKTATAVYAKDGTTIIGYEITTTTTTKGEETKTGTTTETVTGDASTTPTEPSLTEGTKPFDVKDETGRIIGTGTETIKKIEKDGVVSYEITTVTTKVEETNKEVEVKASKEVSAPVTTYTLPERPTESNTTVNGVTTTVTVEDILDADGTTVIGYKTTTVRAKDGEELSKKIESVYASETTTTTITERKPVSASENTKVETTTTEVKVVNSELAKRTVEIITKETYEVETVEVKDTDSWKLIEADGSYFFVFEGKIYPVVAEDENGVIDLTFVEPNFEKLMPTNENWNSIYNNDTMLQYNKHYNSLDVDASDLGDFDFVHSGEGLKSSVRLWRKDPSKVEGTDFENNAEEDEVELKPIVQYEMTDRDGNRYYVLCADISVDVQTDEDTKEALKTGYTMQNVEDAAYYDKDKAAHIKAIAMNGYWGTDEGIGSLDKVKSLLLANGMSQEKVDLLTDGMALAVTQAAVWKYGNSSGKKYVDEDIFSEKYETRIWTDEGAINYLYFSEDEITVMKELYNTLINLAPTEKDTTATTLLTKDTFAKEVEISLDGKTEDGKYQGSISFTLEVKPSMANDDLVVTITDANGNVVATRRVAGKDDGTLLEGVETEKGMTYTLEGLSLAEDVNLTINLSGTQYLEEGAYIFSAADYTTAQTFVGVAKGTRTVDLSVDVSFSTQKPEILVETAKESETSKKTDTKTETKTDIRTETQASSTTVTNTTESAITTTVTTVTGEETTTVNTKVEDKTITEKSGKEEDTTTPGTTEPTTPATPGTTPGTTTPTTPGTTPSTTTPSTTTPTTPADTVVDIADEDVPLGSGEDVISDDEATTETKDETVDVIDIEDPSVPLADAPADAATQSNVPKTGDISFVWMALCMLSGLALLGMAVVVMKRENEKR